MDFKLPKCYLAHLGSAQKVFIRPKTFILVNILSSPKSSIWFKLIRASHSLCMEP